MCDSSNRLRLHTDRVAFVLPPMVMSARAMLPLTMKLESVFTATFWVKDPVGDTSANSVWNAYCASA